MSDLPPLPPLPEATNGLVVGFGPVKMHVYAREYARLCVLQEREAACAIVFGLAGSDNVAQRTADAIRARGTP